MQWCCRPAVRTPPCRLSCPKKFVGHSSCAWPLMRGLSGLAGSHGGTWSDQVRCAHAMTGPEALNGLAHRPASHTQHTPITSHTTRAACAAHLRQWCRRSRRPWSLQPACTPEQKGGGGGAAMARCAGRGGAVMHGPLCCPCRVAAHGPPLLQGCRGPCFALPPLAWSSGKAGGVWACVCVCR